MKKHFFKYVLIIFTLSACSFTSIKEKIYSFGNSEPDNVSQAVANRVNPDTDIYAVGSAKITNSGSMIAQSRANKDATKTLKNRISDEISSVFDEYIDSLDAHSKSLISPAKSDLISYATDLSVSKTKQKGAWEDSEYVYSLLVVQKSDIRVITHTVLKNFLSNTAKKLGNVGNSF